MKTEENLNLDQNNKNTKNDNWKVGVSMAVGAVIGASGTSALADTLHGDVDVDPTPEPEPQPIPVPDPEPTPEPEPQPTLSQLQNRIQSPFLNLHQVRRNR